MGTEESGGWRKARRDGVAALPGPSPLPAARPWPVTPRLGHLHLPLPTFLSLAFLPLTLPGARRPIAGGGMAGTPGAQLQGTSRNWDAGRGQDWEGARPDPVTPRSQVTRLRAAGGPGGRWGTGGTRSSLSPAENSPSPASSHARAPLWEAAAEPGTRAWAGRPPSGGGGRERPGTACPPQPRSPQRFSPEPRSPLFPRLPPRLGTAARQLSPASRFTYK